MNNPHASMTDSGSVSVLEKDIDHLRERISGKVDSLEQRLSPGHLLDQTLQTFKAQGGEVAANIGQSAKQNPLALMLVGVGLFWLMKGDSNRGAAARPEFPEAGDLHRRSGSSTAQAAGSAVSSVKDAGQAAVRKGAEAFQSVERGAKKSKETLSEVIDNTSDVLTRGTSNVQSRVVNGARQTRQTFETMLEEQPLVIGAIGMAIGAAIGGLVPSTRAEAELMGATRDDLLDQATRVVSESVDAAKESVAEGLDAVREQVASVKRPEGEATAVSSPAPSASPAHGVSGSTPAAALVMPGSRASTASPTGDGKSTLDQANPGGRRGDTSASPLNPPPLI